MKNQTIYIAGYDVETGQESRAIPCGICRRMINNAQIERIVFTSPEWDNGYEIIFTRPKI